MNALIASLQFISALPLGRPRQFDPRGIIVSFPLAGLAIGLVLAICDRIFVVLWTPQVAGVLDAVLLAAVTVAAAAAYAGSRSAGPATVPLVDGRSAAVVPVEQLRVEVLARYPKVVVPEMNLGQLSRLLRAEYLVDARSITKVQGVPFTAGELEAAMEFLTGNKMMLALGLLALGLFTFSAGSVLRHARKHS